MAGSFCLGYLCRLVGLGQLGGAKKTRQGDVGDTVAEHGTLGAMRFAPLLQDVWQNG